MTEDTKWKVNAAAQMTTLLSDAMDAVSGDRMNDYGTPAENYKRISGLWNSYLYPDKGRWLALTGTRRSVNEVDAVILMILTKVARLMESPEHYDTWKDIAGYAAVGWAISSGEGEEGSD